MPALIPTSTSAGAQSLLPNLTFNETDNPQIDEADSYTLADMSPRATSATATQTPWQPSARNGDAESYTWRIDSLPACATKLRVKVSGATNPTPPPAESSYGYVLMVYKISSAGTILQGNYSVIKGTDNSTAFGDPYPYGMYVWSKENPGSYEVEGEWSIQPNTTDQFGIALMQFLDEDNDSGAYSGQATINTVEASGDSCASPSSAVTSSPVPSAPKTGLVESSSTSSKITSLIACTGLVLSLALLFYKLAKLNSAKSS